jgi:hypothetical protein
MSLLVYNLTAAPLTLNNGLLGAPKTVIPASTAGAGVRGEPWYASGDELEGLDATAYAALQTQQSSGLVAFEWQFAPEYPTGTLVVGSAQSDIADLNIDIYVDAAAGNDTNPGTLAQPVKTLARALAMLPVEWRGATRIFLKSGAYTMPTLVYVGKPVGPAASPLQILGDTPTNLFVATVTAFDPARYSFTDGALALTPNDLVGKYMFCVTGLNAGRWRLISENTANTIYTVNRWNSNIANGDTFQIVDLNTTVALTANTNIYGSANVLGARDIIFELSGFQIFVTQTNFVHPRCRIQNGRYNGFNDVSGMSATSISLAYWPASVSPFNTNMSQAGTFIDNISTYTTGQGFTPPPGVTFVARDSVFLLLSSTSWIVAGVQTHGETAFGVFNGSRFECAGSASNKQIYDGYTGGDGVFTIDDRSQINFGNNGTFRNVVGPAVTAFDYSIVQIGNIAGGPSVTGYGVELDFSSKLALDTFGSVSALTGALGDFSLKGVGHTYAAVRALAPQSLFDAYGNSAEVEPF